MKVSTVGCFEVQSSNRAQTTDVDLHFVGSTSMNHLRRSIIEILLNIVKR
jgi:hypothetical protein